MWGMIATWRMALEGVSEAAELLEKEGNASDAIVRAICAVEDLSIIKVLDTAACRMKKWK